MFTGKRYPKGLREEKDSLSRLLIDAHAEPCYHAYDDDDDDDDNNTM